MSSRKRGKGFSDMTSDPNTSDHQPGRHFCQECQQDYVCRNSRDIQRHMSTKQHEKNAQIKTLNDKLTQLLTNSPVVTDQYNIRPCIRDIHDCVYQDINNDDILGEAAIRRVIAELNIPGSMTEVVQCDSQRKVIYHPSEKSKLREKFDTLRNTLESVKINEITTLVQQMMMVFALKVIDSGETLDYVGHILPSLCETQLSIVPQGLELARHYCDNIPKILLSNKMENAMGLLQIAESKGQQKAAESKGQQNVQEDPQSAQADRQGAQADRQGAQAERQGAQADP
ncbi:hypothetical protein ACOMHN_001813 [Nucella lapillus]